MIHIALFYKVIFVFLYKLKKMVIVNRGFPIAIPVIYIFISKRFGLDV